MLSSILLQNGTLLIHNAEDHVTPLKADLLVVGNKISEIGPGLSAPSPNTTVIDCTGKLVSPGFVDTHHHVWQTQLKGRHANDLLLDYIPKGQAFPS
jgi:cytosine/adenosine deaminase-related metal-dependent hydrolase